MLSSLDGEVDQRTGTCNNDGLSSINNNHNNDVVGPSVTTTTSVVGNYSPTPPPLPPFPPSLQHQLHLSSTPNINALYGNLGVGGVGGGGHHLTLDGVHGLTTSGLTSGLHLNHHHHHHLLGHQNLSGSIPTLNNIGTKDAILEPLDDSAITQFVRRQEEVQFGGEGQEPKEHKEREQAQEHKEPKAMGDCTYCHWAGALVALNGLIGEGRGVERENIHHWKLESA